MPSSSDEESSPEQLGDITDLDCAPETCKDIAFAGLAVGGPRCRVHGMEPNKCVAFDGTNTGRKFYMCSVGHHVFNCGFVDWADEEWPETLQNALKRLWAMYHEAEQTRIEENKQNAKVVEGLVEQRNKFKEDYLHLMAEFNKIIKDTQKSVMEENLEKMNEENNAIFALDRAGLEDEVMKLHNQLFDLKEEKKLKEEEWEKERQMLKEEKKKVEYVLYDLFKVSSANKEKLLKIKSVVGEL